MSLEYDQYLAEHIGNVDVGLHWMMDNLPLNQEQMNAIQEATLSAHDESKFSVEEYDAYDQYFYGGNPSFDVKQAFDRAWLHHIHCNPHHWQHWVLLEDDPKTDLALQLAKVGTGEHRALLDIMPIKLIRIPLPEIFEMIADWWTFSWKDGNLFEIFTWYGEHRGKQFMHPKSREIVEDILQKMWRVLVMDEVLKGKNRDELAKQYIGYWLEEPLFKGYSFEPSGKVPDDVTIYFDSTPDISLMQHIENGLEDDIEHSDEEDDEDLYGVPELKKFPMPDKKHVKSAIRFFNYIDPKHEQELAEAILEKAEEFGLDLEKDISVGDENRFRKYLKREETE